jgi:hypothetical protein
MNNKKDKKVVKDKKKVKDKKDKTTNINEFIVYFDD